MHSIAFWVAPLGYLAQLQVSLPAGATVNVQIVLRWLHFLAGITWIGLLYFFNLVNVPFLKEIDPPTRLKVVPSLMPRALWWFRWSSVVTVLVGFAYWNMIVSADAQNAAASGGRAILSFLVIWTLAFMVEMAVVMSPAEGLKNGTVLGFVVAVAVIVAAYVFLTVNSHGWESSRMLSIGVGGGLGWFMMFNVWGIIWRVQKKIIRWTTLSAADGTPMPPEAAKLARVAFLVSRTNFVLSFPMLFFMGAASHYPLFGK
ncbi:MAG TPA: urate hydroxylase PuuD [Terriglobales bacterium]|nr:urate hydroxylase PuuD [Terriglobales bacterium]